MLPRSTHTRSKRDREKVSGRTQEIQRLIARALRACVDLKQLGERQIIVDCDVIQADGGTRTASITGACIALGLAVQKLVQEKKVPPTLWLDTVQAVSVGMRDGQVWVDLDYEEDSSCDVDMNFVRTGSGLFVEVQGTAEKKPFSESEMASMLSSAKTALDRLSKIQLEHLPLFRGQWSYKIMMLQTWKKLLQIGLDEDLVSLDWTSRAVRHGTQEPIAHAKLIAKEPALWSGEMGVRAVEVLAKESGETIEVLSVAKNGTQLQPGQTIAEFKSKASVLLVFERSMINLVSFASGISTRTHQLVRLIQSLPFEPKPRITATRKTLPGYKELSIESTLIGGAHPHRYNLSGGVLIKENHIRAHGSVTAAVSQTRKISPHVFKIEIEVQNLEELAEALSAGAEVIMLDNFTPELVQKAIELKPKTGVHYEVSGGIQEKNLLSFAIPGVDIISVGGLTHSVKSSDFSLLFS